MAEFSTTTRLYIEFLERILQFGSSDELEIWMITFQDTAKKLQLKLNSIDKTRKLGLVINDKNVNRRAIIILKLFQLWEKTPEQNFGKLITNIIADIEHSPDIGLSHLSLLNDQQLMEYLEKK